AILRSKERAIGAERRGRGQFPNLLQVGAPLLRGMCLAWRPRCSAGFQTCCIAGFQPANASPPPKPRNWRRFCRLEIGDTAGLETCYVQRALNRYSPPGEGEARTVLGIFTPFGVELVHGDSRRLLRERFKPPRLTIPSSRPF